MADFPSNQNSLPAHQQYIELNLSNYDMADVEQLNAWGIWAHGEIERLNAHIRLLQRDNANLKAQQAQSDAQAMHHLVRPTDGAWWQWLMADADRCASLVADAYKGWDTDESWELTLKREIDHRHFAPEAAP